jgi:hypothetical protein
LLCILVVAFTATAAAQTPSPDPAPTPRPDAAPVRTPAARQTSAVATPRPAAAHVATPLVATTSHASAPPVRHTTPRRAPTHRTTPLHAARHRVAVSLSAPMTSLRRRVAALTTPTLAARPTDDPALLEALAGAALLALAAAGALVTRRAS